MLEVLQGYQDKNLDSRVAERNAETLNTNQKLSGLGAAGQGAFDTQSDLRLKRGQTLAQLRMQQSLNDSQAIAARYNAANNLIGTGTLAYQNYLQNKQNNPSTTTPINQPNSNEPPCIGGIKTYYDSYTGERFTIPC